MTKDTYTAENGLVIELSTRWAPLSGMDEDIDITTIFVPCTDKPGYGYSFTNSLDFGRWDDNDRKRLLQLGMTERDLNNIEDIYHELDLP